MCVGGGEGVYGSVGGREGRGVRGCGGGAGNLVRISMIINTL